MGGGHHHVALSPADLSQLLTGVVEALLAGQDRVQATVTSMDTRIVRSAGTASGSIHVQSPLKAIIKVVTHLENDSTPSRLRLRDLQIHQEAGFAAKVALKAANLEGRARTALADPNRALEEILREQLQLRGARLRALGLRFIEDKLVLDLTGETLESNQ